MSNHVAHNTSTTDSTSTSINLSSQIYTNDIACFLSNQRLKQSEIAKCLKLAWVPPPDFAFPEKIEGKQKRKFQYKYLTTFPWLAYSHQKEGAYCKQCILFAFSGGGIANQRLGKLVTEPMVKFKDAINEFKNHEKKEYHLLSVQRANDFLINYESGACNVPSIKNMLGIVSCVATFFSASAKRADKLKSVIEADTTSNSEQSKKMKLKKLCETRWVERHDALITFKSLYIYLVHALEDLQNDTNLETSCKATMYLNSIMKSDFLVSLEVTVTGFSYTLQLSISLQSKQQDLSKALSDIMVIRCALEELRENADVNFKKMFKDIVEFAAKVDVEIKDSSEECLVDNCLTNETLKKADLNIEVVQENKEKGDFEDFKIPSDYIDLLENFEIETNLDALDLNMMEVDCLQYVAGAVARKCIGKYPELAEKSKTSKDGLNCNWTEYVSEGNSLKPSMDMIRCSKFIEMVFRE
ncbi:hypothetical protein ACI65C_013429 [Semiaphis heraclei]